MPQVVRQLPWDLGREVEKDFTMPYSLVRLQWPTATYTVSTGPRCILENKLAWSGRMDVTPTWARANLQSANPGFPAPDGSSNAVKLIPNSTVTTHYLDQLVTLADGEIISGGVFVKKADYDYVRVQLVVKNGSGPLATIRFSTKTLTTAQGTGQSGVQFDMRELDDGWFLLRVRGGSALTGGTAPRLRVLLADDANNITFGDSGKGTLVWGAYLWAGSEKQPYVETTDVPYVREDYIEGGCDIAGFGWDADAAQTGQIELLNDNNSAVALVLGRGVDGVQCTVFQGYYNPAIGESCGPVILAVGELTDSDITPTSAIVTMATTKAGVEFLPKRYHTRAEGFNWLPPDDAQVTWGKEIYIFERD